MKNDDFLTNHLKKRAALGNLRNLGGLSSGIDFLSNDYLGLAQDKKLQKRIAQRWKSELGQWNGSTGSRLLSGNHQYYKELETLLNDTFLSESSLVFNSGYAANLGLISSVTSKDDLILYDELSHACIKDGVRLTYAKSYSFKHNDIQDLRRLLSKGVAAEKRFVIIESLYSMDGDFAPMEEILEVCDEFDAYLIVDEAHTTGVHSTNGAGWLVENGWHNQVFARIYTFGKAIGGHGACVAGSKTLIEYLINFSRPFIYTTALPPHTILSLIESFRFLGQNLHLQSQLQSNIEFYKGTYKRVFGKELVSDSAIQPYFIGDNNRAVAISKYLLKIGIDALAIRSPTVKTGSERIRICLHAFNTEEEILKLVEALKYSVEE